MVRVWLTSSKFRVSDKPFVANPRLLNKQRRMMQYRRKKRASRRDEAHSIAVVLAVTLLLLLVVRRREPTEVHATSSSAFPGRMPPVRYEPRSNSSRNGYDDDKLGGGLGDADDDEIESSSDDESLWGSTSLQLRKQQQPSDSDSIGTTKEAASGSSLITIRNDDARSSSQPQGGSAAPPATRADAPVMEKDTVAAAATAAAPPVPPSQPLQTLQKLQSMLDETDYLTTSRRKQQQQQQNQQPANVQDRSLPSLGQVTASSSVVSASSANAATPNSTDDSPMPPSVDAGRLWTSKDRAKYKKQQHKIRKKQAEMVQQLDTKNAGPIRSELPQSSPPIHPFSDDEQDQLSDDFDDGLGFSIPNVPVYYSDAEGDSDAGTDEPTTAAPLWSSTATLETPPPPRDPSLAPSIFRPQANHTAEAAPYQPLPPPLSTNYYEAQRMTASSATHPSFGPPVQGERVPQQQQHYYPPYPPYGFPYVYQPPQYGPYIPPPAFHGQFGPWNPSLPPPPPGLSQARAAYPASSATLPRQYSARGVMPPPPQPPLPSTRSTSTAEADRQLTNITSIGDATKDSASAERSVATVRNSHAPLALRHPQHEAPVAFVDQHMNYYGMAPAYFVAPENPQSLAEASSYLNLASIEKVSLLLVAVALACYAGVSPRMLPLTEYNLMFYENLRLVSLATIAPAVQILSVCDARENDMNALVNTFFVSFTFGYLVTFAVEIVATTMVRLAVFYVFEPRIFAVTPTVPSLVLPWVLRDIKYRPKRITLFAADFATTCVACPVIEEYMKLLLLRWTVTLPRNFNWVSRASTKGKQRKRIVADAITRNPGEKDVTTANKYVTQMLAVSLGLKLCDAGRRILLYTKSHHANKSFFAIFRGIFPIHELCGTVTALALAKRDLLGFYTPLWKLLAPAVVFHGMANYRGMKPIFKWNSSTPWSEMQLYPLNFADSSTFPQLLSKGFGKFMWFVVLGRVLGYCIKNYYLVNRQAVKRTTTYAGKHSAFSAELETAEALKKQKQK